MIRCWPYIHPDRHTGHGGVVVKATLARALFVL